MVGDLLPESWRWSTLGEVADPNSRAIVSGPFGSNIGSRFFVEQGVPVIRGNNLTTDMIRFIDGGFVFVTEEKADDLGNCDAVVDDIVFTAAGSLGQVGIIPKNAKYPRYIISNKQLRARLDKRRIDPLFAFYWFSSNEMVEYVQQRNTGSSVPLINLSVLRSLPLPLPPLSEQCAIAHILGTLDDKIELNRRMNETLEAMARAIFKSWFVDFEPVRAKAEGRDPGLPKPLAALFPDSFEDSELGEIPKGWAVAKLGDLLAQRVERCVASSETAARPYVPIDCISSKSLFLTETKSGEEAQSSLAKFYKGDLLFGAMRPYFHKVCIAPFDGTTRTTAFVLFPRAKEDFSFATLLLHHPDTIDYATRHSTGSTIPYAVWSSSLEEMLVIVPPSEVRNAFDGVVRPMLDRIPEPHFQNRTLAALRDTLLPKLISGELRVKAAEDSVKEATA